MNPITITQGNCPLLTGSLVDANGTAVNLASCTVAFAFQGPGAAWTHTASTVSPSSAGHVSYQLAAGETDVAGDYKGQWRVTDSHGVVTIYPLEGEVAFEIVAALPAASPSNILLISQMYEPVRVCLGDFNPAFRKYSDDAVASVLRTCLQIGKVPGQSLGSDRWSIAPGITLPSQMALLMYHGAKMFMGPQAIETRIGSRALDQRKGRPELFWFELNNAIYDLENGEMFSCFQSFYAWVNSLTGIDIWSVMSDMKTDAPVATVNIGRAGVTVSTT